MPTPSLQHIMRPDQPHRRGGMPLEVGPFAQIIGESTSPTLERTVATDNKALVVILAGIGVVSAVYLVHGWWEKNGQTRARGVALKELLGESAAKKEHFSRQSMPGSTAGIGALSSSSSSDSKSSSIGKRRQRSSSKSSDTPKKPHQDIAKDPSPEPAEPLAAKLKAWIPGIPGPSGTTATSSQMVDDSTQTDIDPPIPAEETGETNEPKLEPTETGLTPSMSAAERKKAKKKQMRANRHRHQITTAASSESDLAEFSTDISTTAASPERGTLDLDEGGPSHGNPGPSVPRRVWQAERDRTEWDADSVTPTATAHTTPTAKWRSRMESNVDERGEESAPGSRDVSVSPSDASREEPNRERNDSAPSLSHTLPPKSPSGRSASVPAVNPATPPTPPKGLNLNTDFGDLEAPKVARNWNLVGANGKPMKKPRTADDTLNKGGSISPPTSSASPLSNYSNPLPNLDAVSAQTQTEASSASWTSETTRCEDCERRKQSDVEVAAIKASFDAEVAELASLKAQLAKIEKDEARQRDLVKSLTATNTSLSERVNRLQKERDTVESNARSAAEKIRSLENDLVKERANLKRLNNKLEGEERRREKEKENEDWKRKHDHLSRKYNEQKDRHANIAEQTNRNAARQEAHIAELSRMIANLQAMPSSISAGMIAQNPNSPYQMMPSQMMIPQPNASPMTPGFGGMPQTWMSPGYSVPSSASAYSQYETGSHQASPSQPPRHRYDRNTSSGPGLTAGPVYDHLSGMWGIASPTATSARPPPSPSRNRDISTSILKPRTVSTERATEGSGVPEPSVGETSYQVKASDDVAPASGSTLEFGQRAEEPRPYTPESGNISSGSHSEKPTQTKSAPSGRLDHSSQASRPPLPLTGLEFAFPRISPDDPTGNSPESSSGDDEDIDHDNDEDESSDDLQIIIQNDLTIEPAAAPVLAEDDYDEPVFASIRPRV